MKSQPTAGPIGTIRHAAGTLLVAARGDGDQVRRHRGSVGGPRPADQARTILRHWSKSSSSRCCEATGAWMTKRAEPWPQTGIGWCANSGLERILEGSMLIHLHIPKNAGTSLARAVKWRLLTRPPWNLPRHASVLGFYFVPGLERRIDHLLAQPDSVRRRTRYFEAHCGWGVDERLGVEGRVFTWLREPVDRTLSVYHYRREQGHIPIDLPIEAWIDAPPSTPIWQVDEAQVRYLAGEAGRVLDVPIGEVTREHLERAKRRLEQCYFVGTVERFAESAMLFGESLGWHRWAVGWSNRTRSRPAVADIAPSVRVRIEARTRLDDELYRHAAALLERRLAEAGPDHSGRLAAFVSRSVRTQARWGSLQDRLRTARRLAQQLGIGRA